MTSTERCFRPGDLPAGTPDPLAVAFAAHLRAVRARGPAPGCGATSTTRPATLPPRTVRVPHLVAVTTTTGASTGTNGEGIGDAVVWEVMPAATTRAWLGARLPDQQFAEDNLAGLLALRAAARTGLLPDTPAGRHLAGLLSTGWYLSIRLVYQRQDLIRATLDDLRRMHH
jgi:hypothetical protein